MRVPLPTPDYSYNLYADFGPRLGSLLLDGLFASPLFILNFYLQSINKELHLCSLILTIMFTIWYHVFLVAKYGGTPGKLTMGIKITKLNFEDISWREAWLRHSVEIALMVLSNILVLYALSKLNEAHYLALSWKLRSKYLRSFYPPMYIYFTWLSGIWVWSELIVLLTNEKKRALHDYIASTVVVKIKYLQMMQHAEEDNTAAFGITEDTV